MPAVDARRCYTIWQRLVADEELYRAVLAGDHAGLTASHNLDATDLAVLDELAAHAAGTRWNVVNLRFRASFDTTLKLRMWMPLTTSLLTAGRTDWLQDICYEYLARHRWQELGHRHFAECRRFVAYIREHVVDRRCLPDHFDTALEYETSLCQLLEKSATIQPSAWPESSEPASEAAIASGRPRSGPAVSLIHLENDIREWIAAADPLGGVVRPEPVTLLACVPSLHEMYWVWPVDAAGRIVFDHCTGEKTSAQIAVSLSERCGFSPDEVLAVIGGWVHQKGLVLV